jgi:predicted nucleic acid-binding protein
VPGYLLDSNHVYAYFCKIPSVYERAEQIPGSQLRVSAITFGEIAAGHKINRSTDLNRRMEYEKWVNNKFLAHVLNVTDKTKDSYAEIIARIWEKYRPKTHKTKTEQHLLSLGVDINDVWIAALALERNFVLVTRDGMDKIKEAVEGDGLKFENWMGANS